MYMLKVCRCCDAILGEVEGEERQMAGSFSNLEFVGHVAYTLCPQCLRELSVQQTRYYQ